MVGVLSGSVATMTNRRLLYCIFCSYFVFCLVKRHHSNTIKDTSCVVEDVLIVSGFINSCSQYWFNAQPIKLEGSNGDMSMLKVVTVKRRKLEHPRRYYMCLNNGCVRITGVTWRPLFTLWVRFTWRCKLTQLRTLWDVCNISIFYIIF